MAVSNSTRNLTIVATLFLVLHFYQNFYLHGAFTDKGVEQVITKSPLVGLSESQFPELSLTHLFGVYEDEQVVEKPEEPKLERLFDSASKEFIGQIGDYQYLLYATADFGGKLTAKLLVKNLDTKDVALITVQKGEPVANAFVSDIALSQIQIGSIGKVINLKLFSRTPAV